MSATHFLFGAEASKLRLSRFGAMRKRCWLFVVLAFLLASIAHIFLFLSSILLLAFCHNMVVQFVQMLRNRTGEKLNAWLAQVANSKLPELQSFAAGIQKDKDIVRAGLTWYWWHVNWYIGQCSSKGFVFRCARSDLHGYLNRCKY